MKNTILITITLLCLGSLKAQKKENQAIEQAKQAIDSVITAEKKLLKQKLVLIDDMVDKKEVSKDEGERLRRQIAEESRRNIQTKTALEREKLITILRSKTITTDSIVNSEAYTKALAKLDSLIEKPVEETQKKDTHEKIVINDEIYYIKATGERAEKSQIVRIYNRYRTSKGGFNFALGFHTLNGSENFGGDKFRVWGSKSVEIGYSRNVRVFKNSNLLHLNYGVSWVMNKLKMKNNDYFVANSDGTTTIEPFRTSLNKSKFKNFYLTLPVNLEIDLTPSYEKNGKTYYPYKRNFRAGIGAYVGVLLNSKQVLCYQENRGVRDVNKGNFHVNDWIYGISAHFGYRSSVFYAKYNLVPLFRNNPVKEYPLSLGIRFGG
ncbi:hypothetical protein CKY20_00510 [Capnocytophaga canis]|uniref:Outer membrane protein beta-barrel domain-containing protein n=1 Tax=Capnocytophaga canis TaxID=1848903 RepID=A0A3A1YK70_9FLAO|nr:hypothetical protein [Capnocytophaga canis]RIY38065.1 hypothetical protein CKY20_00510 [Capnocytophaga canis]